MTIRRYLLAALVALCTLSAGAQQVTTLYFLENTPMRHTINPTFQPVSNGYLNFTPLGWMSFGFGNNSLTMSDVLFVDKTTGKTITPLHPNANRTKFLNQFRNMTMFNGDITLGILNLGARVKENGYLHIGINERVEFGVTLPKSMFTFMLGGGMTDLSGAYNTFSLNGLGMGATAYTEVSGGYSHRLNEQWTIGGKLKLLIGQAYGGFNAKNLTIDANAEEWRIHGNLTMGVGAPVNMKYLSSYIDGKNAKEVYDGFTDGSFDPNQLIDTDNILNLVTPSGVGAAFDLGFTWKPIENLQVSAAVTDLGFIYWMKGGKFTCTIDTVFDGVGEILYSDYTDE